MIEKGGDFGGTWYWNRYPGAMCDVESYIYLPLLEEIGYIPKEKYSHAPEILAHSRAIAEHFDLYRNACFQTEVTEMRWDDDAARWIISTNRGDAMRARFVVHGQRAAAPAEAAGDRRASRPSQGHTFHTSRWDYDYTGGDSRRRPHAASPASASGSSARARRRCSASRTSAEAAEHLYVFQRTPSSIDVRNNRDTDPEWAASLGPGWQKQRMDNFNTLVSGGFADEDLVNDGWTDIIGKLLVILRRTRGGGDLSAEHLARTIELADFEKMEQIRARVDDDRRRPDDRRGAEAVLPPVLQAAVLPRRVPRTFNRPNVTLVDTNGQGVSSASPRAASSSTASSTRSTASSTRPASRSAPTTPGAPATTSSDATA